MMLRIAIEQIVNHRLIFYAVFQSIPWLCHLIMAQIRTVVRFTRLSLAEPQPILFCHST